MPSDSGERSESFAACFDSQGGSRIGTGYAAPTRSGYEFMGWYMDPARINLYDFDAAVTFAFTLYAGWREITEEPEP